MDKVQMASYGKQRFDLVLHPVSGKALPVYEGEVLRISLIEGVQCVDFNCFNLHDYKEHMSVQHTRVRHGFRCKKGDVLFTNPNRYNPMLAILEMPESCYTDLLGPRCCSALYEIGGIAYGFKRHTNCQSTFAECIGKYGLTPDDVHDSFNMWMASGWDNFGNYSALVGKNPGKKGDYVDLLALMDVMAVPIVCGSGDVARNSNNNWWPRPVKLEIFESSDETKGLARQFVDKYYLASRETIEDFHIKEIRTERELRPIPGYKPNFINFPLKIYDFTIELTDADYKQVQRLRSLGIGEDDDDVIRAAFMDWVGMNQVWATDEG